MARDLSVKPPPARLAWDGGGCFRQKQETEVVGEIGSTAKTKVKSTSLKKKKKRNLSLHQWL